MDFNVEKSLAAVARSVSLLTRDGQLAAAVALSRSYETTIADLWDAVTNGERIPRWLSPISGELRLGGRYQLEGNAGGAITACEPPTHFALTWEFGGDISRVEVRISEDGMRRARLALTHVSRVSEHWDEYGPSAVGIGWELGMLALDWHIEQPDEPKPDEAAFVARDDVKAFIRDSSERWGQAAVEAGMERDAAQAAARRTAAFYTGETV